MITIHDCLYEGRFMPKVGGKRISENVDVKTREEDRNHESGNCGDGESVDAETKKG